MNKIGAYTVGHLVVGGYGIDVQFYYRQSWLVLNTFNWISIKFERIIRHLSNIFV